MITDTKAIIAITEIMLTQESSLAALLVEICAILMMARMAVIGACKPRVIVVVNTC